jgi:hypothetical protein
MILTTFSQVATDDSDVCGVSRRPPKQIIVLDSFASSAAGARRSSLVVSTRAGRAGAGRVPVPEGMPCGSSSWPTRQGTRRPVSGRLFRRPGDRRRSPQDRRHPDRAATAGRPGRSRPGRCRRAPVDEMHRTAWADENVVKAGSEVQERVADRKLGPPRLWRRAGAGDRVPIRRPRRR